jgi:hypothetical protein
VANRYFPEVIFSGKAMGTVAVIHRVLFCCPVFSKELLPMKIEQWKLTEITPYENNPRQNDAAVDAVAASIKEFGFRQPIVVDTKGVIICGHTRYKAAQKLGL